MYTIANIKNVSSNTANVTIKYAAKKVIATNIGEHNIFWKTIANNIVAYRDEVGGFKSRKELLKVKRLGQKAFEQYFNRRKLENMQ